MLKAHEQWNGSEDRHTSHKSVPGFLWLARFFEDVVMSIYTTCASTEEAVTLGLADLAQTNSLSQPVKLGQPSQFHE